MAWWSVSGIVSHVTLYDKEDVKSDSNSNFCILFCNQFHFISFLMKTILLFLFLKKIDLEILFSFSNLIIYIY